MRPSPRHLGSYRLADLHQLDCDSSTQGPSLTAPVGSAESDSRSTDRAHDFLEEHNRMYFVVPCLNLGRICVAPPSRPRSLKHQTETAEGEDERETMVFSSSAPASVLAVLIAAAACPATGFVVPGLQSFSIQQQHDVSPRSRAASAKGTRLSASLRNAGMFRARSSASPWMYCLEVGVFLPLPSVVCLCSPCPSCRNPAYVSPVFIMRDEQTAHPARALPTAANLLIQRKTSPADNSRAPVC